MRALPYASVKLFGAACTAAVLIGFIPANERTALADPPSQPAPSIEQIAAGRELFLREWIPNDPRSHGGDGLGPVFNDTSCVACHNQGGAGGGGPASKNVVVISAIPVPASDVVDEFTRPRGAEGRKLVAQRRWAAFVSKAISAIDVARMFSGVPMIPLKVKSKNETSIDRNELGKFHPDLRASRSVVLPHSGTEPEFSKWHPVSAHLSAAVNSMRETFDLRVDLDADSVPYAVWRSGDRATAMWKILEAIQIYAVRLADVLFVGQSMPGFEVEPGLNAEAAVRVGLSSTVRFSRDQLVSMLVNRDGESKTHEPQKSKSTLIGSSRNPTPLFGSGLIDSIPDSIIEQAPKSRHRGYPFINGRVSRLRDGRIGKFGWKGQTASLRDFTLTACAIELGLNVPGHEQAVVPYKPEHRSPGFDLNELECDALIAFLACLPAPNRTPPANPVHAEYLEAGEKLFAETGCAACHLPKLGDVAGIYSDLLLHSMGPALADAGIYGAALPDSSDDDDVEMESLTKSAGDAKDDVATSNTESQIVKPRFRAARRSEWRTPPLWGVRDSGPYLHDGRAETIPDAIAMHGGEALPSTNKFFKLSHGERLKLVGFLKTLTAPQPADPR